ncbi:MarR family transcriptional regulator [Allobranchiibius sp. GilTou38]|uniref:MarR family winged helix-turn-helix transcriptional regulator n=1 Tax=Allobranchiibius sp. GilTou38 TaxID=2815210 RepID=UPI001AA1262A|nr:MarR family transcriptional regulator [Allobranchiibius sp. GilTou38]MBO1768363.1 MarR family transcriptional regulator [Allobranchiibius sp. GilTou38]
MDPSPANVALAVKRLQYRHHRRLTKALAPLGLSLIQWDTLRHLRERPDASLHELAVLTFQTDQSFGSLAVRMADRELIERVPGPGRAVRHRITAEGERLRQAGQRAVATVVETSFDGLTPDELEQFASLLDRVLGADPSGV